MHTAYKTVIIKYQNISFVYNFRYITIKSLVTINFNNDPNTRSYKFTH